jgi:hypothetical protein
MMKEIAHVTATEALYAYNIVFHITPTCFGANFSSFQGADTKNSLKSRAIN